MPVADYTPSNEDVGAVALARTVNDVGAETGTFDDTTRPTEEKMLLLRDKAVDDIQMKIGEDIPEDLWEQAKSLVALRTAMLIELTYFGSEVAQNRSPYVQYKELYDEKLPELIEAVRAVEAGQSPLDEPNLSIAAFNFPPADNLAVRDW